MRFIPISLLSHACSPSHFTPPRLSARAVHATVCYLVIFIFLSLYATLGGCRPLPDLASFLRSLFVLVFMLPCLPGRFELPLRRREASELPCGVTLLLPGLVATTLLRCIASPPVPCSYPSRPKTLANLNSIVPPVLHEKSWCPVQSSHSPMLKSFSAPKYYCGDILESRDISANCHGNRVIRPCVQCFVPEKYTSRMINENRMKMRQTLHVRGMVKEQWKKVA